MTTLTASADISICSLVSLEVTRITSSKGTETTLRTTVSRIVLPANGSVSFCFCILLESPAARMIACIVFFLSADSSEITVKVTDLFLERAESEVVVTRKGRDETGR